MPSRKDRLIPPPRSLPFPPIAPQQILNTSFHSWYPTFRSLTPKARIIPLSPAFLAYLRADGIILPPEHKTSSPNDPEDSGYDDEDADADDSADPSEQWPEIHAQIAATIKDLGGKVVPKLNWSAPKDATWIATTNDMECRTPNDIYLLLKSSDFITHDLEHAFDGCTVPEGEAVPELPYHLVLRKAFNLNPALEFRCFIRNRKLIGISQRDMTYFDFLFDLRARFKSLILDLLDEKVLGQEGKKGFPDENFVLDVYIPPPYEKVWIVDFNPWAARTDPLLFSWLELLTMDGPEEEAGDKEDPDGGDRDDEDSKDHQGDAEPDFVRLRIRKQSNTQSQSQSQCQGTQLLRRINPHTTELDSETDSEDTETEEADAEIFEPEFRLVNRDDPEAYQFSATKYSAHKLPKDVVDASLGGGMKDMMEEWKKVMDGRGQEESDSEDEDE